MIEIRLHNVLAKIEYETGHRPTLQEVADGTGLAYSTVQRFGVGKTGRLDADVLIKLVDFLDSQLRDGCTLADLIAYPPEQRQNVKYAAAVAA